MKILHIFCEIYWPNIPDCYGNGILPKILFSNMFSYRNEVAYFWYTETLLDLLFNSGALSDSSGFSTEHYIRRDYFSDLHI